MDGLKSFEYVLAIAETSSISEAAELLGIAQSALSRYVLKLEKEIGVELFDRKTLPIILTEAGRYYVEAGKKITDMNRQLMKRLDDVKAHRNLEIRVGTGPSRAPALMPLILSEFSSSHPDVRVLTAECRTNELKERLEAGKLDLIITFFEQEMDGFGMEELFEEKVELAVPREYRDSVEKAVEKGTVDLRKLNVPFVSLHEGQQLRNALDILTCGRVKPLYTSDYQESAMALVSHGFGVTLVPSYWKLIDDRSDITYYPLAVPDGLTADERNRLMAVINRRINIFYRKEQFLSETEREYIKAAQKVCKAIR